MACLPANPKDPNDNNRKAAWACTKEAVLQLVGNEADMKLGYMAGLQCVLPKNLKTCNTTLHDPR